jgi:hypothetical protein
MTAKTAQAGNSDAAASTTSTAQSRKGAAAYTSDDDTTPDKGPPVPTELEAKQRELLELQAQQKVLAVEIAELRTLQADVASLDGQLKAGRDAIEKERNDLQTFSTNELKALDAKTRAAIPAVIKDVETTIAKKSSDYDEAVKRTKAAAAAVETTEAELATATTEYAKTKQGVAEAKRVLGEIKNAKKEAQAAEGRNELAVAGYWIFEMERRMPATQLPDAAALTSALAELGKKRKAADDAKREMDAAKADEAVQRKARDEAQKNREAAILERLRSQSDTQKPETAA